MKPTARIVPALALRASVLALLLAFAAIPALAQQRGDDAGRKSKNGFTEGTLAGADVKVTYGRPKVNGRNVWGGLVPYGKVWRAGADEATTVTFSKDVTIDGKSVPAGTYGLFLLPEKDKWTFILSKKPDQWGAFSYSQADDLLRVSVEPESAESAEELTFSISDGSIWLHWAAMKGGLPVGG